MCRRAPGSTASAAQQHVFSALTQASARRSMSAGLACGWTTLTLCTRTTSAADRTGCVQALCVRWKSRTELVSCG